MGRKSLPLLHFGLFLSALLTLLAIGHGVVLIALPLCVFVILLFVTFFVTKKVRREAPEIVEEAEGVEDSEERTAAPAERDEVRKPKRQPGAFGNWLLVAAFVFAVVMIFDNSGMTSFFWVCAALLIFYLTVRRMMKQRQRAAWAAYVEQKTREVSEATEAAQTFEALDAATQLLADVTDAGLKSKLQAIILARLPQIKLQARKLRLIVTQGRPCYYTGSFYQIRRVKRGDEVMYDTSNAKLSRFFIYEQFFEWTDDENKFGRYNITRIASMTVDGGGSVLIVQPMTQQGPTSFYGENVILVKYVIEQLQYKTMQSW